MTEITDKAQELLAGRIDAVGKLSERQHAATRARETADAAERDAAAAWSDATQAGWTSTELRKLGLAQPTTRRGGRPKSTRTSKRPEHTATDTSSSSNG
ncbi:hypothetical protein [Allobranchiibius sp. GilTou38]|uniref:hypothetical protein n=1 Tax=Allobranchiibius sp. GilTou38 TaxID=2815210 RepID=UPI001AA193F7|nr:hypothetical protein [Allobranchiibius sp. GilTou38]MBO1768245.1 hypothetical protein [Allobranchiibius sp. GilTou38]